MGAGMSMWEMPINMRHLTLFPTCVVAVVLFTVPAVGDVVFEDPQPLHPSMLSDDLTDDNPQFATDGLGNWMVVWRQPGSSLVTSFSNDKGETWSAPALVHPFTTGVQVDFFSLHLATDGRGRWLLAVILRGIGVPS